MLDIEVKENFDIKNLTSLKIGGKIKKAYFPKTIEEFAEIYNYEPEAKVYGNLSNTLVSSNGYDGAVIITTGINEIIINGSKIYTGCGVKGPKLAQTAAKNGLSGFEFMIGFPGSLGGNVFMNASAHGQCISDKLIKVKCFSREKGLFELSKDEMLFSYRTSVCQKKDLIVLSAVFELTPASREDIKAKMDENLHFRKTHQPSLTLPNCGSVFRNPEGNSSGRLIEQAGVKGFSSGGARVWENHANFIINEGGSSTDILTVIQKMHNSVKEKFDIELRPEVRYLGDNSKEVEICKNLKII